MEKAESDFQKYAKKQREVSGERRGKRRQQWAEEGDCEPEEDGEEAGCVKFRNIFVTLLLITSKRMS